ncbi:P-loop containing nucleoside triphosphate hydrolase protein [Microdochium trichocladiopsis]|uniref:Origin recognition complex subunit 1 n=1 Tax=Microdochium trichocladiopsis TaxID=1682393 RepID=A0A9P9BQF0_9PEZI|nr:P-loop containing nucleoside triphosphate hydrolase protein [Microdochium trichocladiopsis]KAH7030798.1 P-loop containing nucleoside triphosphate hydrolase protein [Microdochium trichocladiopsis]
MVRHEASLAAPAEDVDMSDHEQSTSDEAEDEWQWITAAAPTPSRPESARKRKRDDDGKRIVGASRGDAEYHIGDCVLLRAEGQADSWVAIISDFVERDEDGDQAANFLWFANEKEIRNKNRKRTDFLPNEVYITPDHDINSLSSIQGKAIIMSQQEFTKAYPTGKVPKTSPGYGRTFVCRRGCNLRTTTYTNELLWEEIYSGREEDIVQLLEIIEKGTQSTRKRRKTAEAKSEAYEAPPPGGVEDDDEIIATGRAPTTPRKRQKTSTVVTPSQRKIIVKKALEFTPLATRTLSPSHHQASPFQIARAQLHVASVPTSLPCRESEFSVVYSHLEAAITDGSGACIYISGTPGTGKTATVREVVSRLDEAVQAEELDDFIFVEINGMKITDPHQSYSLLWEALRGQRVSPSQALDLLEREFNHPSPRRVPCVVLMDELDQLVTKNQSVMYNFFNWPGLRHSRLIVLAVANTMDLPERTLSNKISSRLGLTRITFPGYNHEQLMKIIQSRLEGVPGNIVESDAVQFASRKVAAVSGDARRALDICRRAVELAEAENKDSTSSTSGPSTPSKRAKAAAEAADAAAAPKAKVPSSSKGRVTIATVKRAINEATSSPLQQYLRALPFASKLVLAALLVRNERSGLPDSTFGDVIEEMNRALVIDAGSRRVGLLKSRKLGHSTSNATSSTSTIAAVRKQDFKSVRLAGIGSAAVDLTGAGIIFLEAQRAERPSKIRLAVGDEEVKLAFRDDPEIKALGIAF